MKRTCIRVRALSKAKAGALLIIVLAEATEAASKSHLVELVDRCRAFGEGIYCIVVSRNVSARVFATERRAAKKSG